MNPWLHGGGNGFVDWFLTLYLTGAICALILTIISMVRDTARRKAGLPSLEQPDGLMCIAFLLLTWALLPALCAYWFVHRAVVALFVAHYRRQR